MQISFGKIYRIYEPHPDDNEMTKRHFNDLMEGLKKHTNQIGSTDIDRLGMKKTGYHRSDFEKVDYKVRLLYVGDSYKKFKDEVKDERNQAKAERAKENHLKLASRIYLGKTFAKDVIKMENGKK